MGENLLLIVLFLSCSAFFCLSEGALFSLSRPQRESISRQGGRVSAAIDKLLSDSHKLITTVLFADEVFNIAYSSVIGLTARRYMQDSPEQTVALVSLAVASPTLLVFGEIVPKTAGVKFPRTISRMVAVPLYFFHVAVSPVRRALMFVSGFFTRALGAGAERARDDGISSEELEILVDIGGEEGVLNDVERFLAEGFFKLEDLPAHRIMTPSIDCFTLPRDLEARRAVREVRRMGHSRIPVHGGNGGDGIAGVLYGKDLLRWDFSDADSPSTVGECMREPYFIPRSKPAGALLREFQKNRIHIAMVVDEYGRFDGLVTMEDILEELFGDIEDERAVLEKPRPRVGETGVAVPGGMRIEEFNSDYLFSVARLAGAENLGGVLETSVVPSREENETMGGFVFDLFGRLPEEGERIVFGGLEFTVERRVEKRISEIAVGVAPGEAGDVA